MTYEINATTGFIPGPVDSYDCRKGWLADMKRVVLVLTAACVLIVLVGFTQGAAKAKVYGKDDTHITVKNGKAFVIKLAENPTTGYGWQFAITAPDVIVLKNNEYVPDDRVGKLVGSGGTRILTFEAVGKGSAEIKFVYKPSYPSEGAAEQVLYKVSVE